MNLTNLWMQLFGTTTWLGLDMDFWVSMAIVTLIVVIQNIVFWSMKPKAKGVAQDRVTKAQK